MTMATYISIRNENSNQEVKNFAEAKKLAKPNDEFYITTYPEFEGLEYEENKEEVFVGIARFLSEEDFKKILKTV